MSQKKERQLNESETGFFSVPYEFTGKRLNGRKITPSMLAVAGVVYTYDRQKKHPEAHCTQSYSQFCERLHIARSTLSAGLTALKEADSVKQTLSRRGATYEYVTDPADKRFFVVDEYLCTEEFLYRRSKKEEYKLRRFPKNTAYVYGHIKTQCENPEGNKKFVGSYQSIAKKLNLHKNTVKAAINALLSAEFIYRREKGAGRSEQYYSVYELNERLILKRKKAERRAERKRENDVARKASQTQQPQTWQQREEERIRIADERAERERWYSVRREIAEKRAESFNARARSDETYRAAEDGLRALAFQLARAELLHSPELGELRKREKRLTLIRAERLAVLHISEEDLLPKWYCKKCNDTGFDNVTHRTCDCYPPPKGGGS